MQKRIKDIRQSLDVYPKLSLLEKLVCIERAYSKYSREYIEARRMFFEAIDMEREWIETNEKGKIYHLN